MKSTIFLLGALCTPLLVSCGNSDSGSDSNANTGGDTDDNDAVMTGELIDSAVEGVAFATPTQTGITNENGEFTYLAGEAITFSIGSLQFPGVQAKPEITPVDLSANSDDPEGSITNMARLLQSLDADGEPANGISITASAAASATALNFDVSVEDFESNADVINLVANSGSVNTTLISASAAMAHLAATLGDSDGSDDADESDVDGFSADVLIAGSPWYSIRVYADRVSCGNSYSFAEDGSLSAASDNASISGTYSLAEDGLLSLETSTFGSESWQLDSLDPSEWTSNQTNSNGDAFLERAFSSMRAAIDVGISLGTDCENAYTN